VIFYLIEESAWETAKRLGADVASPGLGENFVHCCDGRQVQFVRDSYFPADQPIVALEIDPTRLAHETRYEFGSGGESERFPHVFGPIRVSDVVDANTISISSDDDQDRSRNGG
jgi:uncharacterized protein (DUF952 family)